MPTLKSTARPVPGFPAYSFTRSGILRRVQPGQGARPGVKKPNRHSRQATYQLFRDGEPTVFSRAALTELVFGTDETFNRYARGEDCKKAILTEKEVREIRADGRTCREITASFGGRVSYHAVWNVLHRRSWRHLQ